MPKRWRRRPRNWCRFIGKRLMSRVQALLKDVSLDEGRLAQEVAFYAERSDITEELVRIRSHLSQFNTYLELDEAVGKTP